MKRLCGVNPPVITIFDENYKVDIEASKKQADFLISKGVDGLAYLGTSGEFSIMTVEEKKKYIKEMIQYVNGRVNVIVGVGDTCLDNTMDLLKFVESAGADGVLLINPYFSVYSTEEVKAYFGYVASHTSLPIIIYNFPDLTGYCFNADVVCDLVRANKNIVGIKDTIGDFNHVLSMQKAKEINPDFAVFSAYENQAMGILACGVDGFINATANFAPEYTVNTYQAAIRGDFNEAAVWFRKMVNAMDIYSFSTPLFLACKQAMYYRVLNQDGYERLPALSLDAQAKANVYNKMRELKLL
ncbi:MAG: dihydrodipicolinate synthase family protein [Eubacteriales bacterium]|nr:dihydrodipicolinate synthase family protein [Eubacteriales bacterium]